MQDGAVGARVGLVEGSDGIVVGMAVGGTYCSSPI